MRKRFTPGTSFRIFRDQVAERGPAGQVGAIGGEIDAGEYNLGEALVRQAPRFLDDRAHRHAARIPAAVGDDAEGAAVVAAVLHLQERSRVTVEAVHELRGGVPDRHDIVDAHALARIEIGAGLELFGVAQHGIDLIHPGIGGGLGLRRAAGDNDLPGQICAARLSDRLTRLPHGFSCHRAGVEDDRVLESRLVRARLHGLGFIGVQATAECHHLDHDA